jgi:NAD(P)-dependent dehydrogenase (short-subunit alcohol dehydrogenase family)
LKDFIGKVAIVTGGASGIGLGMSRAFAARGMKLVIADLDEEKLNGVVKEFNSQGAQAIGQLCDVSKLDEVEALAEKALKNFGAINVACNNAGVCLPTSSRNMKLADWRWIIDVDLWGAIYGVKVFLPIIEDAGEGHISATSSVAGLISGQMMGAYSVAKHGVVALMTATERELRAKNSKITASVLCPGMINTNISNNSIGYRPDKRKPKVEGTKSERLTSEILASLEAGMHPDEVGELTANAIEQNKFWILTHSWWTEIVQHQIDSMVGDQTLTAASETWLPNIIPRGPAC